jgi:hypothetical protein
MKPSAGLSKKKIRTLASEDVSFKVFKNKCNVNVNFGSV